MIRNNLFYNNEYGRPSEPIRFERPSFKIFRQAPPSGEENWSLKRIELIGWTVLFSVMHGVQRRMISVDNFFIFLRLSFFALLLLYVT